MRTLLGAAARTVGPHRIPRRRPALWIVTYHRILPADDPRSHSEEPGMMVQPRTLERHLQALDRNFRIVDLGDWVRRRDQGLALPARACAITFDDGWRDNHEFAWPLLKRMGIPATLFVVSDLVGTAYRFWPNRMLDALREIDVQDTRWQWLGDGRDRLAPTDLIARAKALGTDAWLHERLDETLADAQAPAARDLLDWDEIRRMQRAGVFTIGSHTRHHTRLVDGLAAATLADEIVESARLIEAAVGAPCAGFCYPNGDHCEAAVGLVREHYRFAVTTADGFNTASSDTAVLRRTHLHEDATRTTSGLHRRLAGW